MAGAILFSWPARFPKIDWTCSSERAWKFQIYVFPSVLLEVPCTFSNLFFRRFRAFLRSSDGTIGRMTRMAGQRLTRLPRRIKHSVIPAWVAERRATLTALCFSLRSTICCYSCHVLSRGRSKRFAFHYDERSVPRAYQAHKMVLNTRKSFIS